MNFRNFIAVIFLIIFSSCREEIIPPDNPAGNLNQPVREAFFNSYSFLINAEDITYNLQDYMKFDNSRTQVFISIIDCTSGSVEISLINKTQQVIYNKVAAADIKGEYARVNNIPDFVLISFNNFTGKLKFSVNPY